MVNLSPPGPAGLRPVLERAAQRRQPLARRGDTTTYRLVNGAGDGLPGLVVDRFGDALVAHLYDPALRTPGLFEALAAAFQPVRAVYAKLRPEQASRLTAAQRAALAPATSEWGTPIASVVVHEHGVRYLIRPGEGLSVGLFLDMRDVRAWVRLQARGRTVLNLFAYACGFGVCATLGGAARVLNVDASRASLAWGRENYALNGLVPETRDFVYGDALDWLARFTRREERFDFVVLDPPTFGTTRRRTFAAERDYPRLVTASVQALTNRGILLAATNHAGIAAARFSDLVEEGLRAAGRRFRVLKRWHEPAIDFPVPPRSEPYLKVQAVALD